jgi:soluble lytic murein transglycosylase-like protein
METTTAVVVLLFVMTIFQSFGDNKGYTPPRQVPSVITQPVASVPSGPVGASYLSTGDGAHKPIEQFILRYRKPAEAVPITEAIMRHSKTYDVNPKLVAALIRRESGFNPRAVSSSGACGLGQLLPSTCKTTGVTSPFDIDDNAKGTVRYIKYLLDKFKAYNDRVSFALAGYLEGLNQVERNKGYSSKTAGYVQDIIDIYNKI